MMKGRFPNIEGNKKRIFIKYCGGCNPTYERVEMVQRIKSQMKTRFLFILHDQKDADVLLFVNGCSRSCASEKSIRMGAHYYSIKGEGDFDTLIKWLGI